MLDERETQIVRGFATLAEQLDDVREFSENPSQRIRTGMKSIDLLAEGPAAGEIFTFLGRSFSGKSMVATNIMANNPSLPLVFFSLEMPARQAITRLYSTYYRLDHQDVFQQMSQGTLPAMFEDLADDLERQVIIDKSLSLADMSMFLRQYAEYYGDRPAAVIIDYLELIQGDDGDGNWRTEYTAKALKTWAKDEQVAVFLLHQTNRVEKVWDPPTEDSARSAGYTEADVVIGMWVPGRDPNLQGFEAQAMQGHVHFNVLKNRITGRVTYHDQPLRYKLDSDLRFVDLSEAVARGLSQ